MKKKVIMFLMAVSAISVNAQLKVNQNGNVGIGSNPTSYSKLAIGGFSGSNSYKHGVGAMVTSVSQKKNVGVEGYVNSSSSISNESNFGVVGSANMNPNHGRNFGVCGTINFNPSSFYGGAGIYATNYIYWLNYPDNIQGSYAAYFHGTTNLQGQTMTRELYIPADNRLSENVESVETRGGEGGHFLDNLLRLNVREFNLKNVHAVKVPEDMEEMTEETRLSYEYLKKDEEKQFSRRHFGLSAQELQEIFPDLVLEAQDGYLYVNYTELVPVLIRAIQELKGELDASKEDNMARKAPATTSVSPSLVSGNVLYQNNPNPFKEQTIIRFSLADNVQSASICIFDMTGKMLKKLPVSSGEASVILNGWELGEGMFLYTLIVNGMEIDTKRMIITR